MRDIGGIRNPEWSEFHRLMRSHNLNESDMLNHLMKEHDNMETQQKEFVKNHSRVIFSC
jgi:hypothetical protein